MESYIPNVEEFGNIKRTPPLALLSTELVFQIIEYLDDEDDLLALRMTCKNLNLLTKEAHLKSIYESRRVYLVPASLENMVRIARSDMNTRVHNLEISSDLLYPTTYGEDTSLDTEDTSLPLHDPTATFHTILDTARTEIPKINLLRNNDIYGSTIFTLIFSNLPRLRSIVFTSRAYVYGLAMLTRSEFNLIYPSLGMTPGTRIPKGILESWSAGDESGSRIQFDNGEYREIILTAAFITSPPHLEKINDIDMFEKPMSIERFATLPILQPPRSLQYMKLRALDICFGYSNTFNHNSSLNSLGVSLEQAFHTCLCTIGTVLEELGLHYIKEDREMDILPKALPKLRKLTLRGYSIEKNPWEATLTTCPNLGFIRLIFCKLRDSVIPSLHCLGLREPEGMRERNFIILDLRIDRPSMAEPEVIPYHDLSAKIV
ncbi:hypothetical protein TWF481_005329 [Arthrobotrys musiformis]|uniref:F-box domain-containing protein n=1 Tax=Arthrobotrys musiformis TaxID=47236 RepID=A0AAV9WDD9_9PEZI